MNGPYTIHMLYPAAREKLPRTDQDSKKEFNEFLVGNNICHATEDKAFEFFELNPLRTNLKIKCQLQKLNPERYEDFLLKEAEALHPDNLDRFLDALQRPILFEELGKTQSLHLLANLLCNYPEVREVMDARSSDLYLRMAADEIGHRDAGFLYASHQIQELYHKHFPNSSIQLPVTPPVLAYQLDQLKQHHSSSCKWEISRIEAYIEKAAKYGDHVKAQAVLANVGMVGYAYSVGMKCLGGDQENGIEVDLESAVHYFSIALDCKKIGSELGIKTAYFLVDFYEDKGDSAKALKYLKAAASYDDVIATLEVQVYELSQVKDPDAKTKEKLGDAAFRLADLLREENKSLFLRADAERSKKYLAIAEKNENPHAMQEILRLEKKEGQSVSDNCEIRLKSQPQKIESKQLNENEEKEFHYLTGKMYLLTAKTPSDYASGVQSFSLAAAQGHEESGKQIGDLFSRGLGINHKTLTLALTHLATLNTAKYAFLDAIESQLLKEDLQKLVPAMNEIFKDNRHPLLLLLERITQKQMPGALEKLVEVVIAHYNDRSIPSKYEPYLKQAADNNHADAAYAYAKILQAREAKLSAFDKLTSIFSSEKDSKHYLGIAAINGNALAQQELTRGRDHSDDGIQVQRVDKSPQNFDGYEST